jgi:hypothetical protein
MSSLVDVTGRDRFRFLSPLPGLESGEMAGSWGWTLKDPPAECQRVDRRVE